MHTYKKTTVLYFLLLSFLLPFNLSGQHPFFIVKETPNNFYKVFEYQKTEQKAIDTLNFEFQATSLSIKIPANSNFAATYMVAGKDTFHFAKDPDLEDEPGYKFSDLIVFREPVQKVLFHAEDTSHIYFHLNNSGPKVLVRKSYKNTGSSCEEPNAVGQDEWRAGLPDPIGTPTFNKVHVIIVHHSAGSNTDTDYTQVIRNIYLYHTQTRHYDDIAYNYLISQDGTIYRGRDGRGVVEDDNTLGAHFCSGNTGTMGICLLGDYSSVAPNRDMVNSLVSLLSWKVKKEGLEPHGIFNHPKNDSLPVIAGHRDGCSTECPGELTYQELPAIRDSVQKEVESCILASVVLNQPFEDNIQLFPNPILQGEKLSVIVPEHQGNLKISLFDVRGISVPIVAIGSKNGMIVSLENACPGIYFINLYGEKVRVRRKIVVLE